MFSLLSRRTPVTDDGTASAVDETVASMTGVQPTSPSDPIAERRHSMPPYMPMHRIRYALPPNPSARVNHCRMVHAMLGNPVPDRVVA